jgi:DNA processing protein
MSDQHRLLTLCAIRVDGHSIDWSLLAREAQLWQGLDRLERGEIHENSKAARDSLPVLQAGLAHLDAARVRVDEELARAADAGARLVTVFDEDYPANLRLIFDLPPFLFVRGDLQPDDARAVAVVGTRTPSELGLKRSARMASLLAAHGVTVVSGLARGIDTAAHTATLHEGGRTIAVLGHGIASPIYPRENAELAERIVGAGALVSQFWPSAHPTRFTFPRRNVVASGISQGTVVIEATSTSGAKLQARLALQHGKRVWLVESLVTDQPWAQTYVERRGAIQVSRVEDVVNDLAAADRLREAAQQRQQLALDVL